MMKIALRPVEDWAARISASLLVFLATAAAPAQREVALESLVQAAENRIGLYARSLTTGEELAINADGKFPVGALGELLTGVGAASRPSTPLPARGTPRAVASVVEARLRAEREDEEKPLRSAFETAPRGPFGDRLSPFAITGCRTTDVAGGPGVVGYALLGKADVVVCVLTEGFRADETAAGLLPVAVEAAVRRLAAGSSGEPAETSLDGLRPTEIATTLHESDAAAALFPAALPADVDALVAARRGAERSSFKLGEVARLAITVAPESRERVAVQWMLPGRDGERLCEQAFVAAHAVGDLSFRLPLRRTGVHHVRVVYRGRLVCDRTFYVTGP